MLSVSIVSRIPQAGLFVLQSPVFLHGRCMHFRDTHSGHLFVAIIVCESRETERTSSLLVPSLEW